MNEIHTRTCTVCKATRPLSEFRRPVSPGHGRTCQYCRRPGIALERRFWAKVEIGGPWDCWEWKAAPTTGGYGQFKVDGRPWRASRVAWLLTHGDPGLLWVLHHCDHPPCCNPRHLFLGTVADNNLDSLRKGRSRNGDSSAALLAFARKLSDAQIAEVRARAAAGESGRSIARSMPVHYTNINRLISGRQWQNSA